MVPIGIPKLSSTLAPECRSEWNVKCRTPAFLQSLGTSRLRFPHGLGCPLYRCQNTHGVAVDVDVTIDIDVNVFLLAYRRERILYR